MSSTSVIDLDSVEAPASPSLSLNGQADGGDRLRANRYMSLSAGGLILPTSTSEAAARQRTASRSASQLTPTPSAPEIIDIDELPDIPPQFPRTRSESRLHSHSPAYISVIRQAESPQSSARRLPLPSSVTRLLRSQNRTSSFWEDVMGTASSPWENQSSRTEHPAIRGTSRTIRVGGGIGDNIHSRLAVIRREARNTQRAVHALGSETINSFQRHGQRHHILGGGRRVIPIASTRQRVGESLASNRRMHRHVSNIPGFAFEDLRLYGSFDDTAPPDFQRPNLNYDDEFRDLFALAFDNINARLYAGGQEEEYVASKPPKLSPPTRRYTRMVRKGRQLRCSECEWLLGVPSEAYEKAARAIKEYNELKEEDRPLPAPKMPEGLDLQRKMFAGRCGHVYCGMCANKHKKPIRRPRKDGVTGTCVAEGCAQNISGAKAMIEMFC
ncbi:uncharacterized protein V2V93DRAFT_200406 [Kockiozyma suomiensis]|uniref:uncharacterized protein n=1 Tax=Kockiozyma suomiensis TaxID=1337062 RepID=UPI003343FC54